MEYNIREICNVVRFIEIVSNNNFIYMFEILRHTRTRTSGKNYSTLFFISTIPAVEVFRIRVTIVSLFFFLLIQKPRHIINT